MIRDSIKFLWSTTVFQVRHTYLLIISDFYSCSTPVKLGKWQLLLHLHCNAGAPELSTEDLLSDSALVSLSYFVCKLKILLNQSILINTHLKNT